MPARIDVKGRIYIVNKKGEYVSPVTYNPTDWVDRRLLASFGLYDNFGYPFWRGRSLKFGRYKLSLERFGVRLVRRRHRDADYVARS